MNTLVHKQLLSSSTPCAWCCLVSALLVTLQTLKPIGLDFKSISREENDKLF